MAVIVSVKGQRKLQLVTQENRFRVRETPEQPGTRVVQEYGLAEWAAEFVYGRLQDHPRVIAGTSIGERLRAIVQRTRRRKVERRHLLR